MGFVVNEVTLGLGFFSPSISVCPVRIIAPMLHSHILFACRRRRIILAIDTASLTKVPPFPPRFTGEFYHHEASNIFF